jgi:hypothetical protein
MANRSEPHYNTKECKCYIWIMSSSLGGSYKGYGIGKEQQIDFNLHILRLTYRRDHIKPYCVHLVSSKSLKQSNNYKI